MSEIPTFGYELTLDLHGCNRLTITNEESLKGFAIELCANVIYMKRFGEPFIEYNAKRGGQKTAGLSMIQLVETSAVSVHASEARNSVYVNIFSCQPFPFLATRRYCRKYFEATHCSAHLVRRK